MRIDNPQVSKLEFQPGAVVADSNFTGSFTGSFVGDATGASYTAPVLSSAAQGQARLTANGTAAAIVDLGLQAADAVTFATVNTGQGANELYAMNQAVQTTNAVTFASVNTGQGVNELYAMNQDVKTTDAVTFATVNTGQGANELYDMNQDVKTTDAVTFATVNTGQGANELYDMNQNVKSDSSVTFDALTVTNDTIINGDLTVNGTTVSINATNLNVEDKLIAVASGSADSAAADGAGLFVSGAAASLTYTHSGTKWNLNKALDMGSNSISTTGEVAVGANGIRINGTLVTSTGANLNLVNGVTGTLVTEAGEQTLTNKTIAASQVTEISGLTAVEGAQLENIGSTTISATQWGYLGATSAFGATLIDDADAASVRTTIGLGNVDNTSDSAKNAATVTLTNKTIAASQVTEISGLTAVEGAQLENIGSTTISADQWGYLGAASAFGATLLDDADAATSRATLGLNNVTNTSDSAKNAAAVTLTNKTIAISQVTELSNLTAVEGAQLEAIGTTTISATQWGYLGATNQGLTATSDVQFNDVQVDSFGVGTAASGTTGEIRATGDITAYYSSDERLKENFAPLAGALDKVNQIGGYEFDWKEGIEEIVSKEGHDIGVKAQEVQAVYPELVHERDNGYLAVDYVKLTAVLIEAVKELSAKVDKCNCN